MVGDRAFRDWAVPAGLRVAVLYFGLALSAVLVRGCYVKERPTLTPDGRRFIQYAINLRALGIYSLQPSDAGTPTPPGCDECAPIRCSCPRP